MFLAPSFWPALCSYGGILCQRFRTTLQLTLKPLDVSHLRIEEDLVISDGAQTNVAGLTVPLISTSIYTFKWCNSSPFSYGLTPQHGGQALGIFDRKLVCCTICVLECSWYLQRAINLPQLEGFIRDESELHGAQLPLSRMNILAENFRKRRGGSEHSGWDSQASFVSVERARSTWALERYSGAQMWLYSRVFQLATNSYLEAAWKQIGCFTPSQLGPNSTFDTTCNLASTWQLFLIELFYILVNICIFQDSKLAGRVGRLS